MHKFLPNSFTFLDQYESKIFENSNTNLGIVYRNYKDSKRAKNLLKIAEACKKRKFKLFVSNNINLAIRFKADGIYIPSFNGISKFNNLESKNLMIIGSAHNTKQINEKILQNCKAIFVSPIFKTAKTKKYLNIHKFNFLTNHTKSNIYALGGISTNNMHKLKLTNARGFAAIGMFKKKTGLIKAGFFKI